MKGNEHMFTPARLLIVAFVVLVATDSAWAQPVGTFRWQLQPYCNVLSLNVIGEGGNYTLDGTDDLCGAMQKASAVGLAFQNPDGTIGFGLTIVTPPGGEAVHIKATINLVTLGGTWSDENGNTGLFVFTPGAGIAGSPRPAAPAPIPSPTKTSFAYDLAPGATSAPMTVPASIPVSLMGIQTVSGFRGVGQASLLSIPGAGGFIEWVGLHSPSAGGITQGFSGTAGTTIVFIDWAHCVGVEVAGAAGSNQIQVHNNCSAQRTGVVTLTY
jgi:hypothetical protein